VQSCSKRNFAIQIREDHFSKSVQSVFPESRNARPDLGQTAGEQQFLLRFA
jgi:hypothetical protein